MQLYNTQLPQVKLPEYGRNVQNLIEYCKTLPDRERRTRFAATIVSIMADVYPEIGSGEETERTLWDHLAMIANYELDIDYPYEITRKSEGYRPTPLQKPQSDIQLRMYGKLIEKMVKRASELPTPEERISLFEYCGNQMKRNFHLSNPTADEDDNKIIEDLIHYAGEDFREEIFQIFLFTAKELLVNDQFDPDKLVELKKKKKKKKKI